METFHKLFASLLAFVYPVSIASSFRAICRSWSVIFQSMEQGSTFRSLNPKYANEDPNYRPIRKRPARFTHFYFYIWMRCLARL